MDLCSPHVVITRRVGRYGGAHKRGFRVSAAKRELAPHSPDISHLLQVPYSQNVGGAPIGTESSYPTKESKKVVAGAPDRKVLFYRRVVWLGSSQKKARASTFS